MKIIHDTHNVDIEKDYRLLKHLKYQLRKNHVIKNGKIIFPKNYSIGCLLGYVTVVDVLPQEEYRFINWVRKFIMLLRRCWINV